MTWDEFEPHLGWIFSGEMGQIWVLLGADFLQWCWTSCFLSAGPGFSPQIIQTFHQNGHTSVECAFRLYPHPPPPSHFLKTMSTCYPTTNILTRREIHPMTALAFSILVLKIALWQFQRNYQILMNRIDIWNYSAVNGLFLPQVSENLLWLSSNISALPAPLLAEAQKDSRATKRLVHTAFSTC